MNSFLGKDVACVILLSVLLAVPAVADADGGQAAAPDSDRHTALGECGKAVVEMSGDVRITEAVAWKDSHYKIRGDLIFEQGGVLTVENSVIELMNSYSKEFYYQWKGGALISKNTTIGGTLKDGVIYQSLFNIPDGLWESTDTTVRYTYVIWVGDGRIRATNLMQGPNPDAICLAGKGEVILKDSNYDITLNVFAGKKAQEVIIDLPVNTPLTTVFDQSNMPGAEYRLELINTVIPNWWFLFIHGVTMDGLPLDITLGDCPSIVPALIGNDLKGEIHLPVPWTGKEADEPPPPVTVGNLTIRSRENREFCWAVYLAGHQTDVTLLGPTLLAELCVYGGTVRLLGEEGTYNAHTTATVVDVGYDGKKEGTPKLLMRNASVMPVQSSETFIYGDLIIGQIKASGNGAISIEHCQMAPITLLTKDNGTIDLRDIKMFGSEPRLMPQGGPIRFLD